MSNSRLSQDTPDGLVLMADADGSAYSVLYHHLLLMVSVFHKEFLDFYKKFLEENRAKLDEPTVQARRKTFLNEFRDILKEIRKEAGVDGDECFVKSIEVVRQNGIVIDDEGAPFDCLRSASGSLETIDPELLRILFCVANQSLKDWLRAQVEQRGMKLIVFMVGSNRQFKSINKDMQFVNVTGCFFIDLSYFCADMQAELKDLGEIVCVVEGVICEDIISNKNPGATFSESIQNLRKPPTGQYKSHLDHTKFSLMFLFSNHLHMTCEHTKGKTLEIVFTDDREDIHASLEKAMKTNSDLFPQQITCKGYLYEGFDLGHQFEVKGSASSALDNYRRVVMDMWSHCRGSSDQFDVVAAFSLHSRKLHHHSLFAYLDKSRVTTTAASSFTLSSRKAEGALSELEKQALVKQEQPESWASYCWNMIM